MIRTLSLVAVLTLLAGVSLGFFAAEARTRATAPAAAVRDPVLEQKVRLYIDYYGLGESQATEVREALREYDQRLMDLLRRLRVSHQEEFRALAEKADQRIRAVLPERAPGR